LPIPPGVFWEEIIERSIKVKEPTGPSQPKRKGKKQQLDPGAAPTSEPTDPDDDEEPEEVMMI
jgi:hypothetical protein